MGQAALSILSVAGFVSIIVLALRGHPGRGEPFWPPPSPQSWQHRWFRGLFRLAVYPLVVLSLWLLWQDGVPFWPAVGGLALMGLGFGLAFRITARMGWRNAFGSADGLVTDGWFAHSRNPVYVATWVGLLGWAVLVPVWLIHVPLMLWAFLYLIAPRFEEPWLRAHYGPAFEAYAARTRRFF